jgi:hypothetical protein
MDKATNFSPLHSVYRQALSRPHTPYPRLLPSGFHGLFPLEVKRSMKVTTPPSRDEIRNERSYVSSRHASSQPGAN